MESTTQQIDLLRFCDPDKDGRYRLDRPWVFEGWRYATDGRVLVRLPAPDEPDYTVTEPDRGRLPRAFEVLKPVEGDWQPWPTVEPCVECAATAQMECKSCGGDGECQRCPCNHPHDCGKCDGTGKVACDACRYSGFDFLFGETKLARRYAYLIATSLSNVEWLGATSPGGMVRFRFAGGGEGAVMGVSDK